VTVLAYLLVPVLVVAIAASITWARNRQPTSLQSGVDSFRREMDALSPDAAPTHRRRTDPSRADDRPTNRPAGGSGPARPAAERGRPGRPASDPTAPPRRPPSADRRP
jgi:hypothetical protein